MLLNHEAAQVNHIVNRLVVVAQDQNLIEEAAVEVHPGNHTAVVRVAVRGARVLVVAVPGAVVRAEDKLN